MLWFLILKVKNIIQLHLIAMIINKEEQQTIINSLLFKTDDLITLQSHKVKLPT